MKRIKQFMIRSLLVLMTGVLFSSTATLLPLSVSALAGGSWQAGNIIDDSVFYDSGALTVNEIQDFLNSKVPVCDTMGTQIYSGTETRAQYSAANGVSVPFTLLKQLL